MLIQQCPVNVFDKPSIYCVHCESGAALAAANSLAQFRLYSLSVTDAPRREQQSGQITSALSQLSSCPSIFSLIASISCFLFFALPCKNDWRTRPAWASQALIVVVKQGGCMVASAAAALLPHFSFLVVDLFLLVHLLSTPVAAPTKAAPSGLPFRSFLASLVVIVSVSE